MKKVFTLSVILLFTGWHVLMSQTATLAAKWPGYNAATETFPLAASALSGDISSGTHDYYLITPHDDGRAVWYSSYEEPTISLSTTHYLSYTITTTLPFIHFDRFVYNALATLNSDIKLQLRWSVDNFQSSLGNFSYAGTNYTLCSRDLSGLGAIPGGTIEFRVYIYNGSGRVYVPAGTGYPSWDGTPASHGAEYASASIWYIITPPDPPVASAATDISATGFTANWFPAEAALKYYLDIATDDLFANLVTGFDNKDMGTDTTIVVSGLDAGTDYYYRVRAENLGGASGNSATVMVTTLKNDQTITFDPLAVVTYGDADFDPGATSSSGLAVTYTSSDPLVATIESNQVHLIGVGTVTISADQAGDATYNAAPQVSHELTVNPKALTVTDAVAENKVYDGTTDATISGATLSGVVGTDDVTLTNATSGTFALMDVGIGISVTTAMDLGGAAAGNYTLTQPILTADITAKDLTVTDAVAENKVYDGTTDATISGATLSGVVGTDDVTLTNATSGTFTSADAGTGISMTTAMDLEGAASGNYTLIQPALTADITARPLEITPDAEQSKLEGEDDPVFTYSVTSGSLVSGDAFSGSLSRVAGESPDFYAIEMGTLTAGMNYTLTLVAVDFEIKPTVGIDGQFITETRVYPNPADEHLTLEGYGFTKITIYSIIGSPVLSTELYGQMLDISELPKGVYFIVTPDKQIRNRFIKQ
ncbi:MAG: T9SS type A sorting domain-containing protein [Bacteroidales bacterium]|nr:T9SS type A sorting domain-containing protein [Bacteroidales bacterium]